MSKKWDFAVAPVIIVLAVLALCAGVCRADELSDLRATETQLNARIDQTAKPAELPAAVPPTLDTAAPDGASRAGSFPRSFLIPGTRTSIRIGGSISQSFYVH